MVLPVCGFCCIILLVIIMKDRLPLRQHPRLDHYDYSTPGAYFITICTHNRLCLLSYIGCRGFGSAEIQYTTYGQIAEEQLFLLEKRYPCLWIRQSGSDNVILNRTGSRMFSDCLFCYLYKIKRMKNKNADF